MTYRAVILGQPYSKANSRKFAIIGGKHTKQRVASIKSDDARAWVASAQRQLLQYPRPRYEGPLRAHFLVFYASNRPDLDVTLVRDVLQDYAYVNDRQIVEEHSYKRISAENPRVEIVIEPIQGELI